MVGKFIVFEGIEAVGKTSQIKLLEANLNKLGLEVVTTREPGGCNFAENIRKLLLSARPQSPLSELFAMFSARAEHLAQVIKPALLANKWVLSDRYIDSSFAYQGAAGVPLDVISKLEKIVIDHFSIKPNYVFLLDADFSISKERRLKREAENKSQTDSFEILGEAFFIRARDIFIARAKQNTKHFYILDANKPLEIIAQEVMDVLSIEIPKR